MPIAMECIGNYPMAIDVIKNLMFLTIPFLGLINAQTWSNIGKLDDFYLFL